MIKILKKTFKYCLIFILLIFGLIGILIATIQLPPVQLFAIKQITTFLNKKIPYPIDLQGINIGWLGQIIINDLIIKDTYNKEMLSVGRLEVRFNIPSLLTKNKTISSAKLVNPVIKLAFDPKFNDINIGNFIYCIEHINDIPNAPKPPPYNPKIKRSVFTIKNIIIENAFCSFNDPTVPVLNDRFQFPHFAFDSINLKVSNFNVIKDTFRFKILNLDAKDKFAEFKIKNLKADYAMCPQFLRFENLEGNLGRTFLSDTVSLRFNKYSSLANFNDSVKLKINFKNSLIYASDIGVFVPNLKNFGDAWTVDGSFNGKVKNFRCNKMRIGFGKTSFVSISGHVKGFPNSDSTFCDIKIHKSLLFCKDILKYGLATAKPILCNFHRANVSGFYRGYTNNFECFGNFDTPIGDFDINLKMITPQNFLPFGKYFAEISTKNLHLGEALNDKSVGQLSSHLFIEGSGFSKNDLNITTHGVVDKINFQNFDFHNIIFRATIENEVIKANLDVKDSNLVADATFELGLKSKFEFSNLIARVQKLNLQSFGLTNAPIIVSSDINLKTTGWGWGNLAGKLDLSEFKMKFQDKIANYSNINAVYHRESEKSDFKVVSDAANFQIVGLFNFQNLLTHFQHFSNLIHQSWNNPPFAISSLYKKDMENLQGGIDIDFNFSNKNINPLLNIFSPGWQISPLAIAKGNYISGHNHDLKLEASADSLAFNDILLKKNTLKLAALKSKNTPTLISDVIFSSEYQQISDIVSFENFKTSTSWINNKINFNTAIKQQDETNEASLNGEIEIYGNHKKVNFYNTFLKLLDKNWLLDSANKIDFAPELISFHKMQFNNENQKIAIDGSFAATKDKSARILIDQFKLENFNKLLGINLFGNLNSTINIRNIFNEPDIKSDILIDNLKIKNFGIGKVEGASNWDIVNSKLLLDLAISKENERFFDISGYYKPKEVDKNKKLNLLAKLNNTHLSVFEPFIGQLISNIKGNATGQVQILGNLLHPELNGKIAISDAGFKLNYLNTYYTFSHILDIKPTIFEMKGIQLFDSQLNKAITNGTFKHNNFKDFKINFNGNFNNLEILNTSYTDSCVYYGNAFASGNFNVNGNFKELNLDVNAISEKNTQIKVPLNNGVSVEKNTFITFKNKNSSKLKYNKKNITKTNDLLLGMNFNFEFTPEALLEIILDQNSGDNIKGYGNGKINMQINANNDFSMVGNYIFEKDSYYNFTFLNAISKVFNIKKGSNIVFTGDPYESIIDVTASYDDIVPIYPIIDSSAWRKPGIKAPFPVSTILMLRNDLMKPTITYDIQIKDYPAVVSGVPIFNFVSAFENKIRNNENEMNNQVFGLLVFRRFLSPDLLPATAVGNTVSELLSSQLSNIVSQLDENLQVDVNVNGLNRDALTAMQLRVSYTLMDGKIRVTRSSGVTNANNQSATANAIGEWMVEYMLTDDGKFRVKGFNKNNPNVLSSGANNSSNTSAGASIVHTATFNSLNPFKKKRKIIKPVNKK